MNNCKPIFLLSNCFNPYDIVSTQILIYYLQNALKQQGCNYADIKSIWKDTPMQTFLQQMNGLTPDVQGDPGYTAAFKYWVLIKSFLAVCYARMAESVVVYCNEGVVPYSCFTSLLAAASVLEFPTVVWSNDMRSTWGGGACGASGIDPITLGMQPSFWKNMAQYPNSYATNLANDKVNGIVGIGQASCTGKGNTFIQQIRDAIKASPQKQCVQGLAKSNCFRVKNLIELGNRIINYVNQQYAKNAAASRGKKQPDNRPPIQIPIDVYGWGPSLYPQLKQAILSNKDLLSPDELTFISNSTTKVLMATQIRDTSQNSDLQSTLSASSIKPDKMLKLFRMGATNVAQQMRWAQTLANAYQNVPISQ